MNASAVALLMAAGRGLRYRAETGRDKRLALTPDGEALLLASLRPLRSLGVPTHIVIDAPSAAALGQLVPHVDGVSWLPLPRPAHLGARAGLGLSLAQAIRRLIAGGCAAEWVFLALADMPCIAESSWARLLECATQAAPECLALRAMYRGKEGHPVAFRRTLWPALTALDGDQGARTLWCRLSAQQKTPVELGDPGVCFDVDCPADWLAWPSRGAANRAEPA
ncbi:MAG: NTP transferase domain-containing protein [Casimicrobiaceae bacterium]|nr:NTP transferase domain-containing protein [Casimicrobiaceae bacterium]MDW8311821.1 NTP transferase domain-containing protein [Burkholderiales bacterium]